MGESNVATMSSFLKYTSKSVAASPVMVNLLFQLHPLLQCGSFPYLDRFAPLPAWAHTGISVLQVQNTTPYLVDRKKNIVPAHINQMNLTRQHDHTELNISLHHIICRWPQWVFGHKSSVESNSICTHSITLRPTSTA
jgi:hypothetical protein